MANNERVSQLLELYATDLQSNDIFLVTDLSQHESKKLEVGQLLTFIENSGSFFAYAAASAASASYVRGSNVDGIVSIANFASQSISTSYAIQASNSFNANSASWALFALTTAGSVVNSQTASFLQYSGTPNGTASYSQHSLTSDTAATAFNLYYSGIPNGTASFAISASAILTASYAFSSSACNSSSFAVSASITTSASYAQTSSYFSNQASFVYKGPTFITPITVLPHTTTITAGTFDCTSIVPAGTQVVILDGWVENHNTNVASFIYIRANSLSPYYVLTSYESSGGGDGVCNGGQGSFPLDQTSLPTLTFQYSVTGVSSPVQGANIRLIGYY